MSLFFSSRGRTCRDSHPRSSNYCVCDRVCTHTDLLHEHFSGVHTLRVHFAHSYACHTHAWLKGVCSAHVVISLSSDLLLSQFHPSLLLLSLDGHLETTPTATSLTFSRPRLPAELPRPRSAGQAHSTGGRGDWLPGRFRPQHTLWSGKDLWIPRYDDLLQISMRSGTSGSRSQTGGSRIDAHS